MSVSTTTVEGTASVVARHTTRPLIRVCRPRTRVIRSCWRESSSSNDQGKTSTFLPPRFLTPVDGSGASTLCSGPVGPEDGPESSRRRSVSKSPPRPLFRDSDVQCVTRSRSRPRPGSAAVRTRGGCGETGPEERSTSSTASSRPKPPQSVPNEVENQDGR